MGKGGDHPAVLWGSKMSDKLNKNAESLLCSLIIIKKNKPLAMCPEAA